MKNKKKQKQATKTQTKQNIVYIMKAGGCKVNVKWWAKRGDATRVCVCVVRMY